MLMCIGPLYQPPPLFNARLLQTCKTIHVEALPILCGRNSFVLHVGFCDFHSPLVELPPEPRQLNDLVLGRNKSVWDTVLQNCPNLQKPITVQPTCIYRKESPAFSLVRLASIAAEMKKGTREPRLSAKLEIGSSEAFLVAHAACARNMQRILLERIGCDSPSLRTFQ